MEDYIVTELQELLSHQDGWIEEQLGDTILYAIKEIIEDDMFGVGG